ncbi:hypothetical protein M3O57_16695 [Xanthomonas nasturtii]|uniref:Uncharacterized protein n=1 Tax=Xanthomonas nasturtii TaxID=1843581 RepID=A0A3E1KFL8_9XANT|nr:hypothetical protein [Xanthomonas nasturtii]MCL1532003.1 hypothetical protein [Xanthomonas nasturtii]MCL1566730.1 hypothetical protein [Xanthomonas nasturtii]MCL1570643.1 hypothetical protein [Xanthomonas nasturtii]MCL1574430.1 hypothetical protein [Xanthomonas nasturtii]MCL1582229.1 hypothetical protein [Xanthomonas nasturtii]
MLNLDLSDESIFGNEAGEDEDQFRLNEHFVNHEVFNSFFDKSKNISVVSARKGMGKSALISQLRHRLEFDALYDDPIIVTAKGNDLLGLGDFSKKDQAYFENYWKQIICKKIILEIGSRIEIALTSDEMSMVELAELDGLKSKNLVGGLVSRVLGKIPLLNFEKKDSIPENCEALLKNFQSKYENHVVWVLVDDIDAKFQNNAEYQARVGSFFSAIRGLAFEQKNIRIRATVRSDVWSCLRHLEDLDKLDQYLIEIFWNKAYMREMLVRKILSYVKRKNPESPEAKYQISRDYNKILDLVFISPIEWGGDRDAKLFDAISTFSNRRPRWMVQLCRMSASKAREMRKRKINFDHIDYVLEDFGKKRRDDLIKEHGHQFKELEALIDAFRAADREFKHQDINNLINENYIRGRISTDIPSIDGSRYVDAEDLGHFLYKLNLVSRVHPDGKKFTHFSDDPDLYRSNENRAGRITWAIHPAYRTFLKIR